ncbi:hypothetical protein L3Y34_019520 [Caenorhabditis briggsae]|uniref:Uncharacterized protein n=1 Tax=Caenorhabditis briggsae TaxID=6238 RepID=A0AAE9DMZ8_CAEBR|nr:hypothetical protein L3Y34_019520 [Caenorhabditis briggsae]
MSFPTLANLTKKKIIEYAVNGSLPPTACLDPVTSNTIFQQLLPSLETLDENTLEVISKIFKPTSINLTGINMTEKIFEKYPPVAATRRSLRHDWSVDENEKGIGAVYDLPSVLRSILKQESRDSLTHLDLSPEATVFRNQGHTEHFADGWAREVSEMDRAYASFREEPVSPPSDHDIQGLPGHLFVFPESRKS